MKNICILGSTGSIGTQTLEIVRAHPAEFRIVGLSAHGNAELFERQSREFQPRHTLLTSMSENPAQALSALAAMPEADIVVNAVAGTGGLAPSLAAAKAGKTLALANKESVVMAGELLMKLAEESGAKILPVDSEPAAVWQLLEGGEVPQGHGGVSVQNAARLRAAENPEIEKIILTASGGPFWKWKKEELVGVTASQALKHPTWKMGEKVSIDSATLMNKAFEIIEARWFFNMPPEKIGVVVHRQSIVHALVQYGDGNFSALMSTPDMRIPIAHALFYPHRAPKSFLVKPLDFSRLQLDFEAPDYSVFEGPKLAYEVLDEGGVMPAAFCLADEIAVAKFLRGEISFLEIYDFIKRSLDSVKNLPLSPEALSSVQEFFASS